MWCYKVPNAKTNGLGREGWGGIWVRGCDVRQTGAGRCGIRNSGEMRETVSWAEEENPESSRTKKIPILPLVGNVSGYRGFYAGAMVEGGGETKNMILSVLVPV